MNSVYTMALNLYFCYTNHAAFVWIQFCLFLVNQTGHHTDSVCPYIIYKRNIVFCAICNQPPIQSQSIDSFRQDLYAVNGMFHLFTCSNWFCFGEFHCLKSHNWYRYAMITINFIHIMATLQQRTLILTGGNITNVAACFSTKETNERRKQRS
jgi:hypothetical protein